MLYCLWSLTAPYADFKRKIFIIFLSPAFVQIASPVASHSCTLYFYAAQTLTLSMNIPKTLTEIDKIIAKKKLTYKRVIKTIFTIAIILSIFSFTAKFINDLNKESYSYRLSYFIYYGYFYYILWIVFPALFFMLFISLYIKFRGAKDWFQFIKLELLLFAIWLLTFMIFLLCVYIKVDIFSGIH